MEDMSALNIVEQPSASSDGPSAASTSNPRMDVPGMEDDDVYREDIWKYLLEQQARKPRILLQSLSLSFRGALVKQLRECAKKLRLSVATLHCAVDQLDLFMDAHLMRADLLSHLALACLSLAAKSVDFGMLSRPLTPKLLSSLTGLELCGATFTKMEWMVGQHVRWRLLAPTPVTFASYLARYVVTIDEIISKNPELHDKVKRDGAVILDDYLDLTLSDVRLKVVESVDVGCACVACARAELGLEAWPAWLAAIADRKYTTIGPVVRLLRRMMATVKARRSAGEFEEDQGYTSSQTTPGDTPYTSPSVSVSPASSTCSTSNLSYMNVDTSYRNQPVDIVEAEIIDFVLEATATPATSQGGTLPPVPERNSPADYQARNLNTGAQPCVVKKRPWAESPGPSKRKRLDPEAGQNSEL